MRPREVPRRLNVSHDALNSIAALAGVALALLSLAWQWRDRVDESQERLRAHPTITPGPVLHVDVVNVGRKDVWLRAVAINFVASDGRVLQGGIVVKPPPDGAMQIVPKQAVVFDKPFSEELVPKQAVYGEIVLSTTLGFIEGPLVDARFLRGEVQSFGLLGRDADGTIRRFPGPGQLIEGR